jgi:DNA polymerase-1
LETTSLKWSDATQDITAVGFSWAEGYGMTIPFNGKNSPWYKNYGVLMSIREELKAVYDAIPVVGQNFEFDRRWLWQHLGIRTDLLFDTLSASRWLDGDTQPHDLDYLASTETGLILHKKEAQEAGAYEPGGSGEIPLEILNHLCSGDCDATLRVTHALTRRLQSEGTYDHFDLWNMRTARSLFTLDIAGAYLDTDYCDEMEKELTTRMTELLNHVKNLDYNGNKLNDLFRAMYQPENKKIFNIGFGTKRLAFLLFGILHLPPSKNQSTKDLVLKKILWDLDKYPKPEDWNGVDPPRYAMDWALLCREVVESAQEYRGHQKMLGSYVRKFPKFRLLDGCVHAENHWNKTAHGRSSASNPPTQTLPRKGEGRFKRAFVSRFHDGIVLSYDESCLAHISQDAKLTEDLFLGVDIHRATAAEFLGKPPELVTSMERTQIKRVVFGMFYDRSVESMAEDYNMDAQDVQGIVDAFWRKYPDAKKWKDQVVWEAKQLGKVVAKDQMRHRYLPHINNSDTPRLQKEAERQAGNQPIQSLAADLTHHGCVRMNERIEHEGYLSIPFLYVHDSLSVDIYPGELYEVLSMMEYEFVAHARELFPWFSVPFVMEHELGFNLKDTVEVTVENGLLVTKPSDGTLLPAIESVMGRWYNTREVAITESGDSNGQFVLRASFDPCNKPGRGGDWLSWSDDKYIQPALRPYCSNWLT